MDGWHPTGMLSCLVHCTEAGNVFFFEVVLLPFHFSLYCHSHFEDINLLDQIQSILLLLNSSPIYCQVVYTEQLCDINAIHFSVH